MKLKNLLLYFSVSFVVFYIYHRELQDLEQQDSVIGTTTQNVSPPRITNLPPEQLSAQADNPSKTTVDSQQLPSNTNDYGIQLMGSIEMGQGTGIALIRLYGGETQTYKTGEKITGVVLLKQVYSDKAVFQDESNEFEIMISSQADNNTDEQQAEVTNQQKPDEILPERSFVKIPATEDNPHSEDELNDQGTDIPRLEEGQSRTFGPVPPPEPDYALIEYNNEVEISIMERNDTGMTRTFAEEPAPEHKPSQDDSVMAESNEPLDPASVSQASD